MVECSSSATGCSFCFYPLRLRLMPLLYSPSSCADRHSWLRHYTSLSVLLLGALALVVPTGYSIGAALLLLGSAVLLVTRPALRMTRRDWLIIAVLAGYGLLAILFLDYA